MKRDNSLAEVSADLAGFSVTPAGRAVFSSVEDDLQVEFVPRAFGKEIFEISFGFENRFSLCQFPAFCKSMDVGVHRKAWYTERLGHHDLCGFMTNAWKLFELYEIIGNFAAILFDQNFGKADDGLCFLWSQPTWSHAFKNVFDVLFGHLLWRLGKFEQRGRDQVHAFVGALG